MSDRYYGGIVSSANNLPEENFETTPANGVWTMQQAMELKVQNLWPTAGLEVPTYWFAEIQGPTAFTSFSPESNLIIESNGDIVLGLRTSPNAGPDQAAAFFLKLNYQGTIQWQKQYTCSDYSIGWSPRCLDTDSSGDYVVTLYDGSGNELADIATVASDGSSLSENFQIGDSNSFTAGTKLGSTSNDYIVGGYASGLTSYYARFNSSGTVQASDYGRTVNSRSYGYLNNMQDAVVDSSNNLHALWNNIYEGGYVKFNSSGTPVVSSTLGGGGYASGLFHIFFEKGSSPSYFYAGGYAYPDAAAWNFFKVATSNGTSVSWSTQFTNISYSYTRGEVDSSNTYLYMTANSTSYVGDIIILKIATSNGAIQWARRISYSGGSQFANSLTLDNTNNAIVITANISAAPNQNKMTIIRLPTDGSGAGTYGDWTYASFSVTETTASGLWSSVSWTSGSSPVASTTSIAGTFSDGEVKNVDRENGPT